MDFTAFDKTEIEQYTAEAKAKWGDTSAYKECEQKTSNQTIEEQQNKVYGLMMIFAELGKIMHLSAASNEVQNTVKKLQQYITDRYYACTVQILYGLGQIYIADERFKVNIDSCGGAGTAEFVSKAIEIYCDNTVK